MGAVGPIDDLLRCDRHAVLSPGDTLENHVLEFAPDGRATRVPTEIDEFRRVVSEIEEQRLENERMDLFPVLRPHH